MCTKTQCRTPLGFGPCPSALRWPPGTSPRGRRLSCAPSATTRRAGSALTLAVSFLPCCGCSGSEGVQTAGPLWLHHAGRLSGLKAPGRRGTQARAAGLAGPLLLRRVPVHGHAASADLSGHHGRLGVSGQDPRMLLSLYLFIPPLAVLSSASKTGPGRPSTSHRAPTAGTRRTWKTLMPQRDIGGIFR